MSDEKDFDIGMFEHFIEIADLQEGINNNFIKAIKMLAVSGFVSFVLIIGHLMEWW